MTLVTVYRGVVLHMRLVVRVGMIGTSCYIVLVARGWLLGAINFSCAHMYACTHTHTHTHTHTRTLRSGSGLTRAKMLN